MIAIQAGRDSSDPMVFRLVWRRCLEAPALDPPGLLHAILPHELASVESLSNVRGSAPGF